MKESIIKNIVNKVPKTAYYGRLWELFTELLFTAFKEFTIE
jgi:hypothetical protein